jgi:hypothetical protein
VHKLQLISGRVLAAFPLPASFGAARFVDVAVASSSVLALDGEDGRIFRVRAGTLELAAAPSGARGALSIAPADPGIAYVAHPEGIVRVDLSARTATPVAAGTVAVAGLTHIRAHRGSLLGIQRDGESLRAVRVRLDRAGRSIRAVEPLDPGVMAADATAAAIAADAFYYLAAAPAGAATVRRVRLK